MEQFKRSGRGFNYVFEKTFTDSETAIVKVPDISVNKPAICDIGWQAEGSITVEATLSSSPESEDAMWQTVNAGEEINKTVSAFRITGKEARIAMRIIMC